MDTPALSDQQKITSTFLQTLGAVKMTYQERWPIGTNGKQESKKSARSVYLDENHDDGGIQFNAELMITNII